MPSLLVSSAMISGRIIFLTLLVCAFVCFNWSIWLRPTDWYTNNKGLTKIFQKMTLRFPNPGSVPLLTEVQLVDGQNVTEVVGHNWEVESGWAVFPVVLQWGSVMVAALSTAGLVAISRASRASPSGPHHDKESKSAPAHTSSVKRILDLIWLKIRFICTYPLPPRDLWSWACGGLNLAEFLFFAAFIGISVEHQYYWTIQQFKRVSNYLDYVTSPPDAEATPAQAEAFDALFAMERLEHSSLVFGLTGQIMMALMFFPVSRSSFLKWALGSDFSTIIKYHRWMSWWTIIVVFLHSVGYVILYACQGTLNQEFKWPGDTNVNVTGLLSTMGALAIGFTSFSWVRTKYYRVFINVHIVGFIVFILFALTHYYGFVYYIFPALILYGMDRAFRVWQLSNWTRLFPEDMKVDGSIVSLRFRFKGNCRVRYGQAMYLRIPGLSWLQSHPFTVAEIEEISGSGSGSGSAPSWAATIHVKVTGGSWGRGLKRLALSGDSMLVQVEGPYETALEKAPKGPVVVMIAGGIGVTPILGTLRSYLASAAPPTTYFIWSSRTLTEFRLLGSHLLCAASPLPSRGDAHSITLTMDDAEGDAEKPWIREDAQAEGSWLKAALHYTGNEKICCSAAGRKVQPGVGKNRNSQTPSDTDSSPTQSRQVSRVTRDSSRSYRLLSAHPTARLPIYCVCVVLAYFGCYAGMYGADYFIAYYARQHVQWMEGPEAGSLQYFLIVVGMFIFPFLFLVSLSLTEHLWTKATTPKDDAHQMDSQDVDAEGGTKGKAAGPKGNGWAFPTTSVVITPGFGDSEPRMVPLLQGEDQCPGGQGLALNTGRPDIVGLLKMVRQVHAGECDEVVVVVGGPSVQWDAVVEACCTANVGPGPILMPLRVAHNH